MDKERQSHIVRYYGDEAQGNEDLWVDVEILDRVTLNGWQGNRPNNNHFQAATATLAFQGPENVEQNRRVSYMKVYLDKNDDSRYVEIPVDEAIAGHARSKFQFQGTAQHYDNSEDNSSRDSAVLKLVSNDIDEDLLEDNENGKKQPPTDPQDYLEAVNQTDSQDQDKFIHVELLDKHGRLRASKAQSQGVVFSGLWNNSLLAPVRGDGMPGVEEASAGADPTPIRLDPLQAIVNFGGKGGAGTFVTGDECCGNMCGVYDNLKDPADWTFLGELGFSSGGNTNGASYRNLGADKDGKNGTPTFVLVGCNFGSQSGEDQFGVIMTSHDGSNWFQSAKITEEGGNRNSATCMGIVWDEKAHAWYVSVQTDISFGDPDVDDILWQKLYRSSNGLSWSEAGRQRIFQDEPPSEGMLVAHYHNAAGTRDGIFGYWEKRDESGKISESILVEAENPCFANVVGGSIDVGGGGNVLITHKLGRKTKVSSVYPGVSALCATFAGNIMVAGGIGGTITSSVDMGKTWDYQARSPDGDVFCAAGASKKDFDNKKGARRR